MSRRIIHDIEEAISREVRRITFHDDRTKTDTFLEDTFDPFTGEIVKTTVEADFYDSSAETGHRQLPHFFIRLLKTREDRFTNRVDGAQWGNQIICPAQSSTVPIPNDLAFEQVLPLTFGDITAAGTTFEFSSFKARRIEAGHLLRVIDGENPGTYIIDSVTINPNGNHTLEVSNTLVADLPEFSFNDTSRKITFLESAPIKTVQIGDIFEDSLANTYTITAVDYDTVSISIDGVTIPDTTLGSFISRTGDVFKLADINPICFLILDSSKPVIKNNVQVATGSENVNSSIPLDLFYLVKVDSKERQTHIEILNRVWEEFNPPRTALPTIIRSKNSAEALITEDVAPGGSTNLKVLSNSDFNINDSLFVFNDLTPTKSTVGGFEEPFEAVIVDLIGTDTLVLNRIVPDTFVVSDCSKVVSNADYELLAFHFVDHITKDVEGAQYWVHEFQFWVQATVARQGESIKYSSNVQSIKTPIEDLNGVTLIPDP